MDFMYIRVILMAQLKGMKNVFDSLGRESKDEISATDILELEAIINQVFNENSGLINKIIFEGLKKYNKNIDLHMTDIWFKSGIEFGNETKGRKNV